MKLDIVQQESNSRGELLLRSFFGFIYIAIPHYFCLLLLGIWGMILMFFTWWSILITGKFPRSFFDHQVKMNRWSLRVMARLYNLVDGYPAFGLNATDDKTSFDVPYAESYSRGQLLLISFLGGILLIPHAFCLFFLAIGAMFVNFIAWWAVLFTGKYPEGMHAYMVKYIRWTMRLNTYFSFMRRGYPPFNGQPDPAAQIADDMMK